MKERIKRYLERNKWIYLWVVISILFAIIVQWLFSKPASSEIFHAKWGAGDILTYASTVALGLLAVWQNQKFKEENDKAQERLEELLITLATLLILVVCLVIDHFKKINVPAWIQYCAVFVWLQLLNAVVVAMFLIPVIAAVPAFLYQIILKIMQIL